jgi:hypothetical protein
LISNSLNLCSCLSVRPNITTIKNIS